MNQWSVNGVPVFQANGFAKGWMRTNSTADLLKALRQLSLWSERTWGLALDHRLIDVLEFICSTAAAQTRQPFEVIVRATGLRLCELDHVADALQQAGAVQTQVDEDGTRWLIATPSLLDSWQEFHAQLNRTLMSRPALRSALFLCAVRDKALAADVTACFDHFFDLGWLYLHNWGASCYTMACLVQQAMQRAGHQVRVEQGYVQMVHKGQHFLLGGRGLAQPGQIDSHAFCVVDERWVVDFGLGVARRLFRRDMFWAVAVDYLQHAEVVARVDHPRVGQISWHTDWHSPLGVDALLRSQPLVQDLMQLYPGAGQTSNSRVSLGPQQGVQVNIVRQRTDH
jgi:hypothetical protein